MFVFSAWACADRDTLYVDKGALFTAANEPLVMRGFNEMFVWSKDKTGKHLLSEISKTGANTVRLVWDKNTAKADLITLIDNTLVQKMVAIPECHSATGKWGRALKACINFWHDPQLIAAIERNRQWTIVNIANEAGDQNISDEDFFTTYQAAIKSLRTWGYTVPLMIDASLWGQNLDQLLRVGPRLLKEDPLANIIFSVHSYWPAAVSIENYEKVAQKAKALGITMIVGEGPSVTRVGQCDLEQPLPYLEGMKILHEHNVGWLNWSWGGMKNGDCDNFRYFDITQAGSFGLWTHKPGANIVALSPYSVMQTSERPSSFYTDGVVKVSGVYIYSEKRELTVGESTSFKILVAPLNAANKNYLLTLDGDTASIKIDEKNSRLIAIKAGAVKLKVTTQDQGLQWMLDLRVK